jgi:HSP20 family protein
MSMKKTRTTYVRQLQGCMGDIAYELRIQHLSTARKHDWTPAINVYRCHNRIVVCAELAGVDKNEIEVHAEPRSLSIRGVRVPLELAADAKEALQVFALEIDQGTFQREISLPLEVVPAEVRAEQRNGLLWIYLPLAS